MENMDITVTRTAQTTAEIKHVEKTMVIVLKVAQLVDMAISACQNVQKIVKMVCVAKRKERVSMAVKKTLTGVYVTNA